MQELTKVVLEIIKFICKIIKCPFSYSDVTEIEHSPFWYHNT